MNKKRKKRRKNNKKRTHCKKKAFNKPYTLLKAFIKINLYMHFKYLYIPRLSSHAQILFNHVLYHWNLKKLPSIGLLIKKICSH